MPNNLTQFLQELKRRKVMRVITVYAASAFVILEVVDIIAEPLKLPSWLLPVVIVLLAVGFIIAIILSWIYDIQPEGGLIKTAPVERASTEEIQKSFSSWKIASYISFIVIVGLIVFHILSGSGGPSRKQILDKSIAVLPFINDSPDTDNAHIINGIMDDLLINLQSIKELRVPGRTSVEQYRDNPKPIPQIADELNVAYIVEGSGQRYGNKIRFRVQLVEGKTDRHLWAVSYDEVINGPEDIFRIQSQLAESIAAELRAVITPEEMNLINKTPTTSLTAHDYYQRGKDTFWSYFSDFQDLDTTILNTAQSFFIEALAHDSAYARAYTGLAFVYMEKHFARANPPVYFLDSMLMYANMALSYDTQLSDAFLLRGVYHHESGDLNLALENYDNAILLNPNDFYAYWGKGFILTFSDIVKSLENLHKAASLHRGYILPHLLMNLANNYNFAGFSEKAGFYYREAYRLHKDSVTYLLGWSDIQRANGDYNGSLEYLKLAYELDPEKLETLLSLGRNHSMLRQYGSALKYYELYLDKVNAASNPDINGLIRIGYAYGQNGQTEKAETFFDLRESECEEVIEHSRPFSGTWTVYSDLAAIYSYRGDKQKALDHLRVWSDRKFLPRFSVSTLKYDPLYDPIRDEPGFQQIFREVEAKYQAGHEKVRMWLAENELLL